MMLFYSLTECNFGCGGSMSYDIHKDPFEEYIKAKEPSKHAKGYAWYTAIGLQAVDGLETSDYLYATARKNIEGDITIEEAGKLIEEYYETNVERLEDSRTEEADKVATRIAAILSDNAFIFSPTQYLSIHRKLFTGIYSHAGKIRDYNISKSEWVLDGDSVRYGGASELRETLDYDFSVEKNYSYKGLSIDEQIAHLAKFVANLWQIHVFGEGNTRTTAVFFIQYLRTLGFDVTNDIFAENSWYFRNALVRANYNNFKKDIHATYEFLELFLRNLLLGENNELKNRKLHVNAQVRNWGESGTLGENGTLERQTSGTLELSELEKDIIAALSKNPQITLKMLSEMLGKSERTIKRWISTLSEKHVIERVGGKRFGTWKVLL